MARWDDGPRGAKALARWRSTVREAAKQARRPWVPQVEEPVATAELADRIRPVRRRRWCCTRGRPIRWPRRACPTARELIMVVGPEGGITEAELAELTAAGARPVRLGPEVLRASTAAAVALGALAVLTGRWAGRANGN